MRFFAPLPDAARRELSLLTATGEKVRYCLASDLRLDRSFGTSYVVITDARVAVFDGDRLAATHLFSDLSEARVEELFGSAKLVVYKINEPGFVAPPPGADSDQSKLPVGVEKLLAYYSRMLVPEFATLARVINDLIAGRVPGLPDDLQSATCARCGAPLPDRGGSCGLCVPRWQIMRRLLGLLAPYRTRAIVLMVLNLITTGMLLVPPYVTKIVVNEANHGKDLHLINWWIGVMVVVGVLQLGLSVTNGMLLRWLSGRLVGDMRTRLHFAVQRLRMSYFNKRDSGELMTRVMHDTGELQNFLVDGMPFLLNNTVLFFGIAAILVCSDPFLAMLVFIPAPFLIGGGAWFWRRLIPLHHKHGSRHSKLHSVLHESVYGVKAVKIFAQEPRQDTSFDATNEQMVTVRRRIDRTWLGFSEGLNWVTGIAVCGVWFFAAPRLIGKTLEIGDLMAYIAYIAMFYGPLKWFTTVLNWMTGAFSSAERIFTLLDEPPESYDRADAVPLPRAKGAIVFDDVRFSYERGQEVIKGISFTVAPGEMIGLVGKSGGGKSTVISLICRFYDPDSGAISVDGHPIAAINLHDLRRSIGIVMQDAFLFNGSILENIRYGSPTASFAEVVRAAKAAKAHEFILDREDGYDTMIGERGAKLSGGERQRISIARAILHDPPILILDEATSAVDSETEKAIQEAIANLIKGRTTIAIAHRLATLRNASRLFVIADGKLVESGTHEELLAKEGGSFAKLVAMQTENNRMRAEALSL